MDLTAAASPSIPRPTPPSTTRNNEARDAIEVDRIYLRNNLRLYIREAWHVVEPSTVYLENWHIDLIAEHLEAVPLDEQERMYEVLAAARQRVEAADIETTATRVTKWT